MRLASVLCSSHRSFKNTWNRSPPDNFDIIRDKSLIMAWGSILILFESYQCKPVALFWISTPVLLCSAARRDQKEMEDNDSTSAPGDGTMEITANDDQNVCVKAQPWKSLHCLFSFSLCKIKYCPLPKDLMKLREVTCFVLFLGGGARTETSWLLLAEKERGKQELCN